MSFELFVALRYLITGRKHRFISIISCTSIIGVALGVASLIVVLGVMNGFGSNLREKILGVNAHVVVSNARGVLSGYSSCRESLLTIPGILEVTPFIYSEVMLRSPYGVKGAALRGVDPETAQNVLNLKKTMSEGSLSDLTQKKSQYPGIVIGKVMAEYLGVVLNDSVQMLIPSGRQSTTGFSPEIQSFTVVGLFDTGMYEYDSTLVYIPLTIAQQILGFSPNSVTGLEIKLQDIYEAPSIQNQISQELEGFPFVVRTWMEMNKSLFAALKMEKAAMAIILIMIVLVGSFSIITTLIMLVIEKKKDIAVLMSLGATRQNIRHIFVWQGTIIGFIGTFFGYSIGLSLSFLLEKYKFIKLPQDVYYLSHIPMKLDNLELFCIGLAALMLCFLATLYPARQASLLQPAEVLRYE
jgi:lipoprotein-releasing system permease protein